MIINTIKREDAKLILFINLGLEIESPVIRFECNFQYEYIAELVRLHLVQQLNELKKQIAQAVVKYPLAYLECEEVSKLKSRLVKEWDGNKHEWK